MLTLTLPRVVASFMESKPSPVLRAEPSPEPGRARLMDQIISINHTATANFLERFGTPDLESYLGHLEAGHTPRGTHARWVRPEGTPGIVCRDTAD